MHSKTTTAFTAFVLFASASGHMVMKTPTPYGESTLQSSPLNGDNYKFPCQSGERTDAFDPAGAYNPVVAGQENLLEFTGSAVHGGGSCQLSVTYEYPPPADKSKWKVIQTIIGGCPALAAGNIQTLAGTDTDGRPQGPQCATADTGTECVRQFTYSIPKQLKNGNATLAWTWFNKIGNREMYMNCAPIKITGASDDESYFNSLPEIFVANVPGQSDCTTGEGVLDIPNPGDNVVNGGEDPTFGAQGNCPAGGSNYGSSLSPYSTTAAPSVAPTLKSSNTAGVFAPQASSRTYTSFATVVQSTTVPSSTIPSTTAPLPMSTGSSGSSSKADCTPCSGNGKIICIGSTQFGICNFGCAAPQPLASGTTCSNGNILKRSRLRRFPPHARRHRGFGLNNAAS